MVRFLVGRGADGKFDLDISGVAGFFGGDESRAAMASVNLIRYRWMLGWYNSPGSYVVARTYGVIAGSRFWDGFFPGKGKNPATILGLDGQKGPKFLGAQSGTKMDETGHLAYLLCAHCKELNAPKEQSPGNNIHDEENQANPNPNPSLQPAPQNGNEMQQLHRRFHSNDKRHRQFPATSSSSTSGQDEEYLCTLTIIPEFGSTASNGGDDSEMTSCLGYMTWLGYLLAFAATGFSIAAAIVVAVVWNDFICCIAISIGILCNALATSVYGYGTLSLQAHATIQNAVPGDGAFVSGNDLVIVKGPENHIAKITRARYKMSYRGAPAYHHIGAASIALFFQAISQLILLPAATLNGQVLFLVTFLVSWLYNAYLASEDREKLQLDALRKKLNIAKDEEFQKRRFARWAGIAAASAFYLHPADTDAWLRHLIPNHTEVWKKWRKYIKYAVDEHYSSTGRNTIDFDVQNLYGGDTIDDLDCDDVERLKQHLLDAKEGYEWIIRMPADSHENGAGGSGPSAMRTGFLPNLR